MHLAVTGHRPWPKLGGYGLNAQRRLRAVTMEYLTKLKPEKVYTGMALGFDMEVADACRILEIPYVACLPMPNQDSRWPDASRCRWAKLVAAATEIVVVSDLPYEPYKMQVRNEYMVDNATHLLALWDGSSGGTGNCMKYAKQIAEKRPLEIINCWNSFSES